MRLEWKYHMKTLIAETQHHERTSSNKYTQNSASCLIKISTLPVNYVCTTNHLLVRPLGSSRKVARYTSPFPLPLHSTKSRQTRQSPAPIRSKKPIHVKEMKKTVPPLSRRFHLISDTQNTYKKESPIRPNTQFCPNRSNEISHL